MNIEIDKLTPCLERVSDKEIVDTTFSPATKAELKTLKKWQFKWTAKDLAECEIYKLTVENDDRIQGLIAIQDMRGSNAVYVKIAESAPHKAGGCETWFSLWITLHSFSFLIFYLFCMVFLC